MSFIPVMLKLKF